MSEINVETTKGAGKSASVPPQSLKATQDKPATTSDVGTLDIVIKDPKKLPIANLEFQIIIAGKIVFSGKTDANGNGKTIEGLKIGSIFEVHVKTDKGVFKKVATGTINSEKCSACLVSSKTRFEVSSEPTKGEQGNAEAHKAQVTEGKKQSADTASATGNEPKPHTVKSDRNAKGKPVALVTNGAKEEKKDPEIEALDLGDTARKAAYELKKAHPKVKFTSGRRSIDDQARAMSQNIVTDRQYIESTHKASTLKTKLQKWVDDNPDKKTQKEIQDGLMSVFNTASESELDDFSAHRKGNAFDVQPVEKDADAIKKTIRGLKNLDLFLEKEGNKVRWHAAFK
jgi:hypothetical protein